MFMTHNFENNESWKDMAKSQAIASWHRPHFEFVHIHVFVGIHENIKNNQEDTNFVLNSSYLLQKHSIQADTKKTVITKNRITSKISFRFTQNFSCIRSSLCSRHLQSFKSVLQKLFVSLALKKCAPNEPPSAAGTFGSDRQSFQ